MLSERFETKMSGLLFENFPKWTPSRGFFSRVDQPFSAMSMRASSLGLEEGRPVDWLRELWRLGREWFQETTDPVVLHSPWLRRSTGRALRGVWLCIHLTLWSLFNIKMMSEWISLDFWNVIIPCCLLVILFMVATVKKESLTQSLVIALAISVSTRVLSEHHDYTTYNPFSHKGRELPALSTFVVLCHCNLHPLSLLVVVGHSLTFLLTHTAHEQNFRGALFTIYVLTFQSMMFFNFTVDFTNRVKTVSSGMLFGSHGDDPLQSPVAGRSARKFCWLAAFCNWLPMLALRFELEGRPNSPQEPDVFGDYIPNCVNVAFCLALLGLCLAAWPRCRPCFADMILAYVCITPSALHLLNSVAPILQFTREWRAGKLYPSWLDQVLDFFSLAWLMVLAETQVLIQAGCHPGICMCVMPLIIFNSILLVDLIDASGVHFDFYSEFTLTCILLVSHYLDYNARMQAIQDGMYQSQENAAFSSGAVSNIMRHGDIVDIELERALRPEAKPAKLKAVAVIVHAEIEGQTLGTLPQHLGNLPISSRGQEEAQLLAKDLRSEHLSFDKVISSPSLCCVETAQIFAKHFQAELLVDHFLLEEREELCPSSSSVLSEKEGYAKCFLKYLRYSHLSKKSCVLVTHALMVQVCASILPAIQHRPIIHLEHLAALVATRDTKDGIGFQGCQSDMSRLPFEAETAESQSDSNESNEELVKEADIASWSVLLRGVRSTVRAKNWKDSWQDLRHLILDLPDLPKIPKLLEHGGSRWGSVSTLPASDLRGSVSMILQMSREDFEQYPAPKEAR